ncbi:MAG: tyrosine-protein phosphatase [Acidobacteriota bacterium]|nr:tyrosine-protein phosphatase [Acidobacteriota bacterium]
MCATMSDGRPSRHIDLDGVFNLRDVGGYLCATGERTKWRRLFRSDALHRVTHADLSRLVTLGVVNILDLRASNEIEFAGLGAIMNGAFNVVSSPVGDDIATRTGGESLADRYLAYLSGDGMAQAITELSRLLSAPTIVSCFFGKDRSGTLIALVLSLVGVERDVIIADYALTSTRMGPLISLLQRDEIYRSTIERTEPSRLAADSATMRSFLNTVDERYGSPLLWATKSGIRLDVIDRLRENLLVR